MKLGGAEEEQQGASQTCQEHQSEKDPYCRPHLIIFSELHVSIVQA